MTSSGNETFLVEKYKVGNYIINDYDQALIQAINEKDKTSADSNINTIRYYDFG